MMTSAMRMPISILSVIGDLEARLAKLEDQAAQEAR